MESRQYYHIAHSMQEDITEQPSALVGGKLKEYQVTASYFEPICYDYIVASDLYLNLLLTLFVHCAIDRCLRLVGAFSCILQKFIPTSSLPPNIPASPLTIYLPRVARLKIHIKSPILFCKILKNNLYHAKVLAKKYHLNGHTTGFCQQTQKLELLYITCVLK